MYSTIPVSSIGFPLRPRSAHCMMITVHLADAAPRSLTSAAVTSNSQVKFTVLRFKGTACCGHKSRPYARGKSVLHLRTVMPAAPLA